MKLTLLAVLAACTTLATAVSNSTFVDPATNQTIVHFDCGVHQGKASKHFLKTIKDLHVNFRHGKAGTRAAQLYARRPGTVAAPITVNTYFHIITTAALAGTYTDAMVAQQAAALNKAYNPIGITFNLVQTTQTTNDDWASAAVMDANMDAVQQALRQGTYADLNLYFHSSLSGGALGTCSLPSDVPDGTPATDYYSDGCNINANTMPGGSLNGYNLGQTAVHETGHWLGLLHTFEGYACSGDGDFIDDTPFESASTNGCPAKPAKDSCPTATGVDPIHNYMDYSSDACYEAFTPGQVARISSLWTQYRLGK